MSPDEVTNEEIKTPEKVENPELKSEVLDSIKSRISNLLLETSVQKERRLSAKIKAENLLDVCKTLKEMGFEHLSSIAGVEYADKFEVVYHLSSYSNSNVIALKAEIPKDSPKIVSLTPIWRSANWHERETYDLMGIIFEGHPNLKRIFNPDDFQGHPLRKDFKLSESPWLEGENESKQ